jgi:uncharacterized protein (TIGR03437 family)
VWYSDGGALFARTAAGRVYRTEDFETWTPVSAETPEPVVRLIPQRLPEAGAKIRTQPLRGPRVYALARAVYRSDDAGASWSSISQFRGESLIGDALTDLAVSPRDDLEIAVAGAHGVWRSVDGGLSWSGVNNGLPNLPVVRLLSLPGAGHGVRLALTDRTAVEWSPGERQAWRVGDAGDLEQEANDRKVFSGQLGAQVTALARAGEFIYLGTANGQLIASSDRGRTWQPPFAAAAGGPVERFWVDAKDPRAALAVLAEGDSFRVLRTLNGGTFWDALGSGLPAGAVHGVAADRATGAIYVATDRGISMTYGDLTSVGPATVWTALAGGIPEGRAMDVMLDAAGNQLYVAIEGFGVYATNAPHRARDPRLVSAADFSTRPAAPGSLVSLLGQRVETVRAGALNFPVLGGSDATTEIQVPFEARGNGVVELALDGRLRLPLEIRPVSPAILIDPEGAPWVVDGDSNSKLDPMTPARSHSRIQILATGLGRVRPDWQTGLPAPFENPPQVAAQVRAYLDREPVQVTRAVLAPGFVGFYLIELELPKIVNYGPAELYLEIDGQTSNRVRVYIEP